MQELKDNSLFTELTSEESASVNGGPATVLLGTMTATLPAVVLSTAAIVTVPTEE
jgi:hypothetical protein